MCVLIRTFSDFLNWLPRAHYQSEKMPTSQLELLLQRIPHLREPLVGSLHWTVFHFTTEQGELKETTLYIILEMSTEQQIMAL